MRFGICHPPSTALIATKFALRCLAADVPAISTFRNAAAKCPVFFTRGFNCGMYLWSAPRVRYGFAVRESARRDDLGAQREALPIK
jgi:hypothetical protein